MLCLAAFPSRDQHSSVPGVNMLVEEGKVGDLQV